MKRDKKNGNIARKISTFMQLNIYSNCRDAKKPDTFGRED